MGQFQAPALIEFAMGAVKKIDPDFLVSRVELAEVPDIVLFKKTVPRAFEFGKAGQEFSFGPTPFRKIVDADAGAFRLGEHAGEQGKAMPDPNVEVDLIRGHLFDGLIQEPGNRKTAHAGHIRQLQQSVCRILPVWRGLKIRLLCRQVSQQDLTQIARQFARDHGPWWRHRLIRLNMAKAQLRKQRFQIKALTVDTGSPARDPKDAVS